MAPAGLPRIGPPVVVTSSRDPTRAEVVGAVPATAAVTMTDAATTASVPITPILRLRLAPDRRSVWFPDISHLPFGGVRRGRSGKCRDLRPERLRQRTFIIMKCSAKGEHQSNDSVRSRIPMPVPGTRPDGIAVVVYRDKRGAQVPEGQVERGASRSGGRRSIQRGEKMEGAEEMGGRVGHRHVPMVDRIDLRDLFWSGLFCTTWCHHVFLFRARHAIHSPDLKLRSRRVAYARLDLHRSSD